ncbi:ribosomal RNA small subunit methyltransferase A [bacterium]|nr:ribosomal RNA small subunit methyltransferase A [bacterium]
MKGQHHKTYKGVWVKKRLGQNFLQDEFVLQAIGRRIRDFSPERVIEIGAGTGELTDCYEDDLSRVVLLEIDPDLVRILGQKFDPKQHITVLEADAAKYDYGALFSQSKERTVVTGNLPYVSAIRIMKKFSPYRRSIAAIIVTLQLEVAEKIRATYDHKAFAAISVYFQYHYDIELSLHVPRNLFFPVPKVDSAVLVLRPHERYSLTSEQEKTFHSIVHQAFLQRRKKVLNALEHSYPGHKRDLEQTLVNAGIDPALRADQIPTELYVRLTCCL